MRYKYLTWGIAYQITTLSLGNSDFFLFTTKDCRASNLFSILQPLSPQKPLYKKNNFEPIFILKKNITENKLV